jgi:hypothetical protein
MAVCMLPKHKTGVRFPSLAQHMLKESEYLKIQVHVPTTHAKEVRKALGKAGAGKMGNYEYCSGSYRLVGRFTPVKGATPAVGKIGKPEEVEEESIQTICHRDLIEKAVEAIKEVHPYDEPAIDIMPRYDID